MVVRHLLIGRIPLGAGFRRTLLHLIGGLDELVAPVRPASSLPLTANRFCSIEEVRGGDVARAAVLLVHHDNTASFSPVGEAHEAIDVLALLWHGEESIQVV